MSFYCTSMLNSTFYDGLNLVEAARHLKFWGPLELKAPRAIYLE